jgi:hypothetical protein
MLAPNPLYRIRLATPDDAGAVRRLAELDSQSPLAGEVLVAEHEGALLAAVSLEQGRAVADPFRPSAHAVTQLRLRAGALVAARRTPSLADRVRAAIHVARVDTGGAPAEAGIPAARRRRRGRRRVR